MRICIRTVSLAGALALWAGATDLQAAGGLPPPGEYRVDAEVVMTTRGGPVVQRVVTTTQGDTGATAVTRSSSLDARPVVSKHPGAGPVRQCVRAGAVPAPWTGCTGTVAGSPACASAMAPAGGAPIWRALGPGRWEMRLRYDGATPMPAADAAATDPHQIFNSPLFAQLPVAEREALRAELARLPADAVEQASGQAAQARQQAQAAGQPVGDASGGVVWDVVQRWTATGQACK